MTQSRSSLISLDATPSYHCFSRCVRRTMAMRPEYAEAQCPLSLEFGRDLKDPVAIHEQSGVFELEDLLKWYQEDGRHPVTHEPFKLDDLVLLRKGVSRE